jgi:hypothetical protein
MFNLFDWLCETFFAPRHLTNPPREIDIPIHASSRPVAYTSLGYISSEVIDKDGFLRMPQWASGQFSQIGFYAAFYEDEQLAYFTYFKNLRGNPEKKKSSRVCGDPELKLAHGREIGTYGCVCSGVFWGSTYYNGEAEDHNPWSDGIPPSKMVFSKWIRQWIKSIVQEGFRHQIELGKSKQQAIIDLGIQDLSIVDELYRRSD